MKIKKQNFFGLTILILMTFLSVSKAGANSEVAVFAGGCFWCMQPPFDALKGQGVISTLVGYTGGTLANPTYEQTSSGKTGHFEAIQITYDPKKITFKELLKVFWKNIDPYDTKGQFCDKGEVYKSAVFTANEEQAKAYQESIIELEKEGLKKGNIATQLLPLKPFYKAEEYHQNYYLKNPVRYKFYRYNCGRDQRLKEVWGLSPTSKQN